MANVKITDLTAYANPNTTDVLPIVDVGADVTKKISIENLLKNASSGTAAAPGIAFDGDSDTGIYSPGTDQVAISTNGTGRLFVNATGNVGVGGTPSFRLDVLSAAGAGNQTSLRLYRNTGAAGDENALLWQSSTLTTASISDSIESGTAAGLVFKTASGSTLSERARIDSSGRLLVGTSSATSYAGIVPNLQLIGPNAASSSIGQQRVSADADSPNLILGKARGSIGSEAVPLQDDTLGVIRFAGWNSGWSNFGGSIACVVDGEVVTAGDTTDMPGRLVFSTTADGASSPTERMRITSNGDVLFSTDTIASITTAATNANAWSETNAAKISARTITTAANHYIFYNPNGNVGSIQTNGSATSYSTSSDYRLKENITPVTDGITRLQQLKPSRFNFIADPTKTVDGFIAHEVQSVVPEAITGEKDAVDENGNPQYQGIDQSKMVPLVVAALQECIKKVEALEAEVASLKAGA